MLPDLSIHPYLEHNGEQTQAHQMSCSLHPVRYIYVVPYALLKILTSLLKIYIFQNTQSNRSFLNYLHLMYGHVELAQTIFDSEKRTFIRLNEFIHFYMHRPRGRHDIEQPVIPHLFHSPNAPPLPPPEKFFLFCKNFRFASLTCFRLIAYQLT